MGMNVEFKAAPADVVGMLEMSEILPTALALFRDARPAGGDA